MKTAKELLEKWNKFDEETAETLPFDDFVKTQNNRFHALSGVAKMKDIEKITKYSEYTAIIFKKGTTFYPMKGDFEKLLSLGLFNIRLDNDGFNLYFTDK